MTQHPNQMNPLKDIAFEDIDDIYCYGKYDDVIIIMMKFNGHINATKLCQDISEQTGSKKPFRQWKVLGSADELLNAISNAVGIPTASLFNVVQSSDPKLAVIRGTYVHPDLIPHIASWASPKFAVKVARIVNKYFNDQALKEKEKLLQQKDDKIDELAVKIDKLLYKNKKINRRLNNIIEQNNGLSAQNADLTTKLDEVLDDRVIKSDKTANQHAFVVIKDPDEDAKRRYYVIRTKKRSMNQTIKSYKKIHPNAIDLLNIEYNPNSINLWDRIKERLGRKQILCKLNYFGLRQSYTEEKLIEDINAINEDRFAVE